MMTNIFFEHYFEVIWRLMLSVPVNSEQEALYKSFPTRRERQVNND